MQQCRAVNSVRMFLQAWDSTAEIWVWADGPGTRVKVLPFNTTVQLILQDTSIFSTDSHPVHLHGFNFFVVGQGVGNYNESTDAPNFNLIDPVERNTIGVPKGGWAALRFRADNPGILTPI